MGRGLECSASEWGQMKSFCDSGNEPLAFTKCGEFLDLYLDIFKFSVLH